MSRFAVLVAVLLASALAFAADAVPDAHFTAAKTSALVRQSVFIHGYLHGYEDGFHLADLDLQMGREARDVSKCKEGKNPAAYRREFGDRDRFVRGFREGIRVGYADGMAGRAFRALTAVEPLAAVIPSGPTPDSAFDQGFALGYSSGQRQGVSDGRRDPTFAPPLPACPAAGPPQDRKNYCAAYSGGYRVGYADGFINVVRPVASQVEARVGR